MQRQGFRVLVEGRPAPQGSKNYMGQGRFVESSKYLEPWRTAVANATKAEMIRSKDHKIFTGPVQLKVVFFIERPAKPKFRYPATAPDIDKLVRATADALTHSGIWTDDALVVHLEAWERWTGEPDTYPEPGALIEITAL